MTKEIKIEKQCDPRDIYVAENNKNMQSEAVEERLKMQEEFLRAKNTLKAYAEDRKREEVKQKMEKGVLSDGEEKAIIKKLHLDEPKQKEEYVAPECKIVEECEVPCDFDGICRDLMTLHARKNKDYGNAAHESYKEFGLISYVIRLNDKMKRLKSLTRPGVDIGVKDESIEDTLMDLAAYAIMAIESLRS